MADRSRQRILVTGAGGFVGRWALTRLAEVLPAADVAAAGHGAPTALDVTRAAEVGAPVARFRPTAVLHLAGMSSPVRARAETRAAWDVNLFGTMNLAEAVLRHAPETRFVNAGSSEVYGGSFNTAGSPVDESTPLAPLDPYAITKAAADLLLGEMAEAGLAAVRFRPFNPGPGQSAAFALPAFAAQIASAELPRGTVLYIASGEPRRIGDALDLLLALSRVPIRVERDEALMRPSDVPVTRGDAARASLGWRPAIPWERTLGVGLDDCRRRQDGRGSFPPWGVPPHRLRSPVPRRQSSAPAAAGRLRLPTQGFPR